MPTASASGSRPVQSHWSPAWSRSLGGARPGGRRPGRIRSSGVGHERVTRTSMDHMSPLDAMFLHVEDGITHMHIGSCAVFEGPAPGYDELIALVASKLPLLVRYRQKVRFVPGGL